MINLLNDVCGDIGYYYLIIDNFDNLDNLIYLLLLVLLIGMDLVDMGGFLV